MAGRTWFSVADADDVLRGVAELGSDGSAADLALDIDTAKIARQLRHSGRTTIGLLPSSENVDVHPFATELAVAIALLTEKLSVVLDPEQVSGKPPVDTGTMLFGHVPGPLVVTLVPIERAPAGAKFEMVRIMNQLVGRNRDAFGHVLVDLVGCRLPGELLGAQSLLEGIIVVGRAGETTERELEATVKATPEHLRLGVVLTEPSPKRRPARAS